MIARVLLALFFLCAGSAEAALLERDLGEGLTFFRVHALPVDLPPAPPAGRVPACVIDVRYVRADTDAATAFEAWLKFRATPRSPVFVLANGDTSSALLRALARRGTGRGIVVIGVPAAEFEPDLPVKIGAADERRAYEALEGGTPLTVLLKDNPDKVRNDEASFSTDRLAEASADEVAEAIEPKRVPPPIDAALQRAVHLHRALLALGKI